MPSFIEVLGRQIPIYGICYLSGIILSFLVATLICTKKGLPRYEVLYSGIFAVVGGLIGAKLLYILISLEDIITAKLSLWSVINGGFVFYGGFIGGALGLLIYVKSFKLNLTDFTDVYAVAIPLGHALGRIGCLFGGCCYGMPYNGPFAVTYSENTLSNAPKNIPLLPIQGIEAGLLIVLFIILLIIYFKSKGKNTTLIGYFFGYSVIRFVLEYFRYDSARGKLWIFSTSQWISIGLFLVGVLVTVIKIKTEKSKE